MNQVLKSVSDDTTKIQSIESIGKAETYILSQHPYTIVVLHIRTRRQQQAHYSKIPSMRHALKSLPPILSLSSSSSSPSLLPLTASSRDLPTQANNT